MNLWNVITNYLLERRCPPNSSGSKGEEGFRGKMSISALSSQG
jgi:hypothetical protein